MRNVILLSPDKSNGGITSWTKKFIASFPNEEFNIVHISQEVKAKPSGDRNMLNRIITGGSELLRVLPSIKKSIKNSNIDILHTTTSGFLGSIRDYLVGRLCKRMSVPCIIHFRIGCLPLMREKDNGWWKLMFMAMKQYDQIWVLDRKTHKSLSEIEELRGKVFLTPNSIEVQPIAELVPKEYKKYMFIANVLPEKGIFELVEAFGKVKHKDTELHILGPATEVVLLRIQEIAGSLWGNRILYHGKLPNEEAVNMLTSMDSMILPTYYWGEAFPISILEALSKGKLVISCPRAAISDMLTAMDGTRCGILVDERSVDQLSNAIDWVSEHKNEADLICKKGYEKVYNSYRTDVIYEMYRSNYRRLLTNSKGK